MSQKVISRVFISITLLVLIVSSSFMIWKKSQFISVVAHSPQIESIDSCSREVGEMRMKSTSLSLHERYKDLTVIDVHNHDASYAQHKLKEWDKYSIDQVALFGNISEPGAIITDDLSLRAFQKNPDRIYPFFAGFHMYEEEGIEIVKANLEKGFLGIGEVAAASTYSPIVSKLKWKAQHPMDGNLPEIYKLAAEYDVPLLLHIDPPTGVPITQLERALRENPNTAFIFAHANVANTPKNLERLLNKYDNLYIDFFAGYTADKEGKTDELQEYVPLIEAYSDRFVLGTDSGFGVGYKRVVEATYEILNLVNAETACKISSQNFKQLMINQPPTNHQIEKIKELSSKLEKRGKESLTKLTAHELIRELEAEIILSKKE